MSRAQRLWARSLWLLLFSASVAVAQPATYSIDIEIAKVEVNTRRARCTYRLTVQVPSGPGIVVVPLPFQSRQQPSVILDPFADRQAVLSGPVLPRQSFGAVVVAMQARPRAVSLEFSDADFPLYDDPSRTATPAVSVLLRQAHAEVAPLFAGTIIAQPKSLQFNKHDFSDSRPNAQQQSQYGSTYNVALDPDPLAPPDVMLYLADKPGNPNLLLLLLAPVGLIAGFLSAPRIAAAGTKAIVIAILAIVVLGVLIAAYFTVLPEQQRRFDTGVIIGVGTLAGLLLGTAIYALTSRSRPPRA